MMKRVLIVPKGRFAHPDGEQVLDDKTIKRIMARMIRWNRDIVVDYRHESIRQCGMAPAAGWVKAGTGIVTKNGIEAVIEWTQEGKRLITQKKYKFLSPVFERVNGQITGLYNLGLTNNPNIHSLPPLVNQLTNGEKKMEDELMEKLADRLGLEQGADGASIATAVETLANEKASALERETALINSVAQTLGLAPDAGSGAVRAGVEKLAVESAMRREEQTGALVNSAIASGKLRPCQREWAMDLAVRQPDSLERFLANGGATAPLGPVITTGPMAKPTLSENQAKVCRLLGIAQKDYMSFNEEDSFDN